MEEKQLVFPVPCCYNGSKRMSFTYSPTNERGRSRRFPIQTGIYRINNPERSRLAPLFCCGGGCREGRGYGIITSKASWRKRGELRPPRNPLGFPLRTLYHARFCWRKTRAAAPALQILADLRIWYNNLKGFLAESGGKRPFPF